MAVEEGWSTRGDPDEMWLSFPNPEPRLEKFEWDKEPSVPTAYAV